MNNNSVNKKISVVSDKINTSEKKAIITLAALVSVIAVFLFLWNPIQKKVYEAGRDYQENRGLLQWMKANANSLKPFPPIINSDTSLMELLRQNARAQGINADLMEISVNADGKEVSVKLPQASFDSVILWLEKLEREQGVVVQNMSVGKELQSGTVRALIQFRSGK